MLHGIPLQSKNHTALQLHMENTDEMVLSPSAELPQPFHKAQMWMPDIPLSSLSDQVYGMPLKYAELQVHLHRQNTLVHQKIPAHVTVLPNCKFHPD